MSKRILAAVAAAVALIALPAAPAAASQDSRTTDVVNLAPDLLTPVSCPDGALFGFALNISSLEGVPLGTGTTCVASIEGCDPFVVNCRRTVHATLELGLQRGSLTAAVVLVEVLPTESSFIQFGHGKVVSGTGRYRHTDGRILGDGVGAFDDQLAFTGQLVYVLALHSTR
jgi:hypothetical protein